MNRHKQQGKSPFSQPLNSLACLIASQLALYAGTSFAVQAGETFNPALLEIESPGQGSTDLSVFETNSGQLPGTYRVDIYLNNELQDTRDVEFHTQKMADGSTVLAPCLTLAQLEDMGIRTPLFPELGNAQTPCVNLDAIPQGKAEFRFSAQ